MLCVALQYHSPVVHMLFEASHTTMHLTARGCLSPVTVAFASATLCSLLWDNSTARNGVLHILTMRACCRTRGAACNYSTSTYMELSMGDSAFQIHRALHCMARPATLAACPGSPARLTLWPTSWSLQNCVPWLLHGLCKYVCHGCFMIVPRLCTMAALTHPHMVLSALLLKCCWQTVVYLLWHGHCVQC